VEEKLRGNQLIQVHLQTVFNTEMVLMVIVLHIITAVKLAEECMYVTNKDYQSVQNVAIILL